MLWGARTDLDHSVPEMRRDVVAQLEDLRTRVSLQLQ